MTDHLQWVRSVAANLRAKQSLTLGERTQNEPCLVYARGFEPAWTSVAIYGESNIQIYPVPAKPIEKDATFLDLHSWAWLDRLSQDTGDPQYARWVDGMSAAFADYGFDPRSGLGYLGQEAAFNVRTLGASGNTPHDPPRFKPGPGMPMNRLWRDMPRQTARLCRSAYHGLITRDAAEHFDYNRYCYFGFRDADKKPSLAFDSGHVAFAQTASWLIGWWIDAFHRTGDADFLRWARRMTDKYRAAQHPRTGLIPHWFGNGKSGDATQNPQPMCNSGDAHTAIAFLEDAELASQRAETRAIGEQLRDMGLRLMHGLCDFGYNRDTQTFHSWIRVADGAVDESAIVYAFRTQAEKDFWVKKNPKLEAVSVYAGDGLFTSGPWSNAANPALIPALRRAVRLTRDQRLVACAEVFADQALAQARALAGALNDKGQWTLPASAAYAGLSLELAEITGQKRRLDDARWLIDRELGVIDRPQPDGRPEWWRMSFRSSIIHAALDLHHATR